MAVPDFQSLMLPALKALADGADTPLSEVRARVRAGEGLTTEDIREMPPVGGQQSLFVIRVSCAVIHMVRAGLVERVRRGVYRLAPEGGRLLSRSPTGIDKGMLRDYPDFRNWSQRANSASPDRVAASPPDDSADTPEEALDRAVQQLRNELEADVLDRVRKTAPSFLERVVVDLLIAMGYGGGDASMGSVTGRSGDGGIDGTIREDRLGLDEVYVQVKKYADGNTVGEGDLRNFAGAIDAAGTTKGVFVTTATFTDSAKAYLARSPKRIVLIDGAELARLMVRYGIGVRRHVRHEVKRIDEDYFDQETR